MKLRADVRKLCWQLLGPPPEQWDAFYRNADGTPTDRHAEKMAELENPAGTKPGPEKPPRKAARTRKAKVKT